MDNKELIILLRFMLAKIDAVYYDEVSKIVFNLIETLSN
jgi:hypothetical protein